jgi:acetyl-CoA synthetase
MAGALSLDLPGTGYDDSRRDFRWAVPARFNLAHSCIERHPPHAPALLVDDDDGAPRTYTFGELDALAARLANALIGLGVELGDRVGLMVPQGVEVVSTHMACYKAGFVTMPMSVLFGPDAVSYRLEHAQTRALVIYEEGLERFAELLYEMPDLRAVIVVGGRDAAGRNRATGPKFVAFEDALADASPDLRARDTEAEEPCLLLYTSGTTGNPKGVLHMQQWVLGNMPGVRFSHNFFPRGDDRFWTPADWAWGGGIIDALLPTLLCGRTLVASSRKFDPDWAYTLLGRHQIRNSFLPPTALKRMRQAGAPPGDVKMRTIACGGEALGEALLGWTEEHLGVVINEFYGQTEANLWVGNCAKRWPIRPGSMGRPYPGFDVEIHDVDAHEPVAAGETGEIVLKLPSPTSFREYWREPEKTAEKTRGGWLRSGDLARFDEDGYLWFEGRTDDQIGSAGYRIGPTEIEECLLAHPAVAMSAVIGAPDEVRGEVVMAFVVPSEGTEPDAELTRELQDHVKHRLAFYQYPREIRFVSELPMTTTGKIMRRKLREQVKQEASA